MIKWGIIGPGAIAHKFANEIDNTEKGKLISAYGRNEEKVNYGGIMDFIFTSS